MDTTVLIKSDSTWQNIIRDPMWQFIGVIIAIAIAFVGYKLTKKKKQLSYKITATKLIDSEPELKGIIDIVWKGSTVYNVHLIILKFLNSGNVTIQKNDFDRNISVIINKNSNIMEYTLISESPDNLNPNIYIENDNKLIIKPLLLNKGDNFEIKMLVSDYLNLNIDCRIAGVKELLPIKEKSGKDFLSYLIWIGIFFVIVNLFLNLILKYYLYKRMF